MAFDLSMQLSFRSQNRFPSLDVTKKLMGEDYLRICRISILVFGVGGGALCLKKKYPGSNHESFRTIQKTMHKLQQLNHTEKW